MSLQWVASENNRRLESGLGSVEYLLDRSIDRYTDFDVRSDGRFGSFFALFRMETTVDDSSKRNIKFPWQ